MDYLDFDTVLVEEDESGTEFFLGSLGLGKKADKKKKTEKPKKTEKTKKSKVKLSSGHVAEAEEAVKAEEFLRQARSDLAKLQAKKAELIPKVNDLRARRGKSALKGLGDLGVTDLDALLASVSAPPADPFGFTLSAPKGYAKRKARGRTKAIDMYYELSVGLQRQLSALIQEIISVQNEILQLIAELQAGGTPTDQGQQQQQPLSPAGGGAPSTYDPYAPGASGGGASMPSAPGGYASAPGGYQEAGTEALGPQYGGESGEEGGDSFDAGSGISDEYSAPEGDFSLPGSESESAGGVEMSSETGYSPSEDYGSDQYSLLGLRGIRVL